MHNNFFVRKVVDIIAKCVVVDTEIYPIIAELFNVADPDSFKDPFHLVSRIRIQVEKNQPKPWKFPQKSTKIIRISYNIISQDNKLMFKDLYIYPI